MSYAVDTVRIRAHKTAEERTSCHMLCKFHTDGVNSAIVNYDLSSVRST